MSPPRGLRFLLKDLPLLYSFVHGFLVLNVLPNHRLVAAHRRDKVPPGPELLPHKVAHLPAKGARNVNRTLPSEIPHHLRHRILRGNREQHVDVIRAQMPLLHLALLLAGQLPEHLAQGGAQLAVQRLAPPFGDKDHVIFAFPFGMTEALVVVHDQSPFRDRASGSRSGGWSRLPELSNFVSPPAKLEDYPLDLRKKVRRKSKNLSLTWYKPHSLTFAECKPIDQITTTAAKSGAAFTSMSRNGRTSIYPLRKFAQIPSCL